MALATSLRALRRQIANSSQLSIVHVRWLAMEASHVASASEAVVTEVQTSMGKVSTLDGIPFPRLIPPQKKTKRVPVSIEEAIKLVKSNSRVKFDETIELSLNLGTDPRRGDQMVRGTAMLPHGTGKTVRVCVFARGEAAQAAKEAGAEAVGSEDMIADIQESGGSGFNYDKCIATPEMMPKLSKVARILGPRGLMPNPKLGTVTDDVGDAVAQVKKGRVEFRADKNAIVHAGVGKCSFSEDALYTNVGALVAAIAAARPKGVKGSGAGGYVLSASLSSTMGAGVPLTLPSLFTAAQLAKK